MSFFDTLLGSLFPDRCVGCRVRGSLLCSGCMRRVAPALAPEHEFITSIFSYHDFRIRKLILLLKYKNTRHAAQICGPYLAEALAEYLGEESRFVGRYPVMLVPIPLAKKRAQRRGYNQAELLAREALKKLPADACVIKTDLLCKTSETTAQADIKKRSERLNNLGDCFSVYENHVPKGQTIVLIDDVTTTGATIRAARSALKRAGFKKVHALTLAH